MKNEMHMNALLVVFIYVFGDVLYHYFSQGYFSPIVSKIRGPSKASPDRAWALVLGWLFLGMGWYLFAAPLAQKLNADMNKLYAGCLAGLVYGLTVYGIVNMLLTVMFSEWTPYVAFRDMAWGIGWACITLTLYVYME
jgi:hypothetical protein